LLWQVVALLCLLEPFIEGSVLRELGRARLGDIWVRHLWVRQWGKRSRRGSAQEVEIDVRSRLLAAVRSVLATASRGLLFSLGITLVVVFSGRVFLELKRRETGRLRWLKVSA
jgi:hypothetical protein